MKQLFLFMLTAAIIGLMSCSSGPQSEKVATKFFKDLEAGNFDEAKKHATADTKDFIDFMRMGDEKENPFKGANFVVRNCVEEGDTCTCELASNFEGEEDVNDIELVKVDGEWLVDLDKDVFPDKDEAMDGMMEGELDELMENADEDSDQ